jgi:hypothetical protein
MSSILDFLSRVMQAIDTGSPSYLHDKAGQLARAARRLQADGFVPFPQQRRVASPFRCDRVRMADPFH